MNGSDEHLVSGVYQIYNTVNGKRYIGSSRDIDKRWKEHMKALDAGTHHSIKLQRSYSKTKNKDVFQFEILEVVDDVDRLLDVEQSYIDRYDAFNTGYNCSAYAHSPKYTTRGSLKSKRNDSLIGLYRTFWELYDPCTANIGHIMLERIKEKHYKHKTMNELVNMLKQFINQQHDDGCRVEPIYEDGQLAAYVVVDIDGIIISRYNPTRHSAIRLGEYDYKLLVENRMIRVASDGTLAWTDCEYKHGVWSACMAFIGSGNVYWEGGFLRKRGESLEEVSAQ